MRRLAAAPALAVALMIVLSGPVLAAGTVHQVTNAGNDPFAACTVGAGTGINYPRSEVEPFGTVNPRAPGNAITVFQQDRWSNGGAHGLAAGVTTTGGASWTIVPLPFSACAAGTPAELAYQRASDPWVSFGPGNPASAAGATAYAVSLSFNQSPVRPASDRQAEGVELGE